MKERIRAIIDQLKAGIKDVKLLAIVTKTRSEVVFYGTIGNKVYQSNEMAEEGLVDILNVDRVYKEIADIVRHSSQFTDDKINVLQYDENSQVRLEYYEEGVSEYSIRKSWKKNMGI